VSDHLLWSLGLHFHIVYPNTVGIESTIQPGISSMIFLSIRKSRFAGRSTRKENDAFQFLVEEEVIETPDVARLGVGIRIQIRNVGVDVAFFDFDFIVQGSPQFAGEGRVVIFNDTGQSSVDRIHNHVNVAFFAELFWFDIAKVIVWKGSIEERNEVEERFPRGTLSKWTERRGTCQRLHIW